MDSNTNNTVKYDSKCYADETCVNVQKIYDTCKDKDCLTDMRVYLSAADQALVDNAVNIRARNCELVWTTVSLDEGPFNKGFYGVDMTFYFKTGFEVYSGNSRPTIVEGLSFYNKKVILYGSDGNTVTFSSAGEEPGSCQPCAGYPRANLPVAEVELVDPIVLNTRIINPNCNCCCVECDLINLPQQVLAAFYDGLTEEANRKLVVSLGLFSVVRIVRNVQIKIPSARFILPEKECSGPDEEEPCDFFEKLSFPTNEFLPPENIGNC